MSECNFCALESGVFQCCRCGICFRMVHGNESGRIWISLDQLKKGDIPISCWKEREENDILVCRDCILSFKKMEEELEK